MSLGIIHSNSSTVNVSDSTALLGQVLEKHLSYHLLSPASGEENSSWDEAGKGVLLLFYQNFSPDEPQSRISVHSTALVSFHLGPDTLQYLI